MMKSKPSNPPLDANTASAYARCALDVLRTPYPYAMQHLTMHAQDRPLPSALHPVFCGSYDWHSSVHMHWSLARLLRMHPNLPERAAIEAHFKARFTARKLDKELAYCRQFPGFERPYGWAWLHTLWQELSGSTNPRLATLAPRLEPLARHFFAEWRQYLTASHYPQRSGTHGNTAFGMLLSLRAARACGDRASVDAIRRAARRWYGRDTNYPAELEPSANDFLSGGLCEALLMSEVDAKNFPQWWHAFAPKSSRAWRTPARVGSRTDGQMVHLDGLNLSRAWCLRLIAARLAERDASTRVDAENVSTASATHMSATQMRRAAAAHLDAALPHVIGGDFVATHWLVSFALLALGDA
jgi:hypothetical protein